jgi:DNA-binding response OmpR family regulator
MPEMETRPLVLIADPDAECTALLARQLRWAGFGVLTTGEGAEALELIEERRPDAFVVEAKLSDSTGYDLVRHLREQSHNRLMPILMISARAGKLDRDFAFKVGVDSYVRKPFPYSQIVARLAHLAPAGPTVTRTRRPLVAPLLATR